MAEQSGERTQDPTPRRRQQAREKGEVVFSQDLSSATVLFGGVLALLLLGNGLAEFFGGLLHRQLGEAGPLIVNRDFAIRTFDGMVEGLSKTLLPILGLLFTAGIAASMLQIGLLFSPSRITPDIGRLSPLRGFRRIASLAGVMRLGFGLFKVVSETGIAAGVRRIEALTGKGAYRRVVELEAQLGRLAEVLKAPRERLVARATELVEETKQLARELEKAKRASFAGATGDGPFEERARVGDTVVIAGSLPDAKPDDLRLACDQLRTRHALVALILGTAGTGSANLLCFLTKDLVARGLHAGDVVKAAAGHIGGGGGGRPDMAQAGGKKPDGLQAALDAGVAALKSGLGA